MLLSELFLFIFIFGWEREGCAFVSIATKMTWEISINGNKNRGTNKVLHDMFGLDVYTCETYKSIHPRIYSSKVALGCLSQIPSSDWLWDIHGHETKSSIQVSKPFSYWNSSGDLGVSDLRTLQCFPLPDPPIPRWLVSFFPTNCRSSSACNCSARSRKDSPRDSCHGKAGACWGWRENIGLKLDLFMNCIVLYL